VICVNHSDAVSRVAAADGRKYTGHAPGEVTYWFGDSTREAKSLRRPALIE
jgi:hypothetical protein